MPEQQPNEVTPHVLSAMDDFSDAPGSVTWLCPFREYHSMVFGKHPQPELAFFADWCLRGAVNAGLPLNSVVTTGNYLSTLEAKPNFSRETFLLTLLPEANSALEAALLQRVQDGLPKLFYGPADHSSPRMRAMLGLRMESGIADDLTLHTTFPLDEIVQGALPRRFLHRTVLCAGAVNTVAEDPSSVIA